LLSLLLLLLLSMPLLLQVPCEPRACALQQELQGKQQAQEQQACCQHARKYNAKYHVHSAVMHTTNVSW
jgi:hypothetical protein